jgi:hypothetical protein
MGYWDDVTPNSVASAEDGFKEFKIGDNEAFVKKVEEKYSESGNSMLVITFENDEGAEIKHYIVNGEYKLQNLKQFYIAFGIPLGSHDIGKWYGKRGVVVVKKGEPYNGKTYNKVSYLRPRNGENAYQPPSNNEQQSTSASRPDSDDTFKDDIPF